MKDISKGITKAHHEQTRVKRYYLSANLAVLTLLAVTISAVFLALFRQADHAHVEELHREIMRSKREFIKNAVNRTIQDIELARLRCTSASGDGTCDEEQVKERLREQIRAIRLKDKGYIWVNAVLNYDGGENYATRYIHPNLPETEGMMLSTTIQDIKGNTPYRTELEGVKKDGEIFFDYWFKKMDSKQIQHKMTFAKLYKPYDWIVATGVYLDDIAQIVNEDTQRWERQIYRSIFSALAVTGIALGCAWGLSLLVVRRVDSLYSMCKTLSELLPICCSCKKIRDDSGYWQRLEEYFKKHIGAEFTHGICPECSQKLYGDESFQLLPRDDNGGGKGEEQE